MRRRASHLVTAPAAEPVNVTPLIDVVMCLIIFFLIVGKLAANEKARITLPGTTIGTVAERQDAVTVSVARDTSSDGRPLALIYVDGQLAVDGTDLVRRLTDRLERQARQLAREMGESTPRPIAKGKVTVRADKDLPFQSVEPVLAACAGLGITRVDYATARAESAEPVPGSAGSSQP